MANFKTSLQGIAKRASACKYHRFEDLYRLLNEELLLECWGKLNKSAKIILDNSEGFDAKTLRKLLKFGNLCSGQSGD